jgi:SWIM zinc finger
VERAVGLALANCTHRLCLWHITRNALINIPQQCTSQPTFLKDFKSWIFDRGTEDDFHQKLVDLNSKYNLSSNSWIPDLYAIRGKWTLVYQNDTFCASMTTLNWCEALKNFFKKFFNRKQTLAGFVNHFQKVLNSIRQNELYEDQKLRQTKPVLLVDTPMLIEASNSYTKVVYAEFEEEFKNQLQCICQPVPVNGLNYLFRVSLPSNKQLGLVELNPSILEIKCSCKKFEAMGLLCMHALKVFSHNNILHLPTRYILNRWTKYVNSEVIPETFRSLAEISPQHPLRVQYDWVWRKAVSVILRSVCSEDAMRIFKNEINRLNAEVQRFLCQVHQPRELTEEVGDVLEGKRKKRVRKGKGEGGNKRKENVTVQNNLAQLNSDIASMVSLFVLQYSKRINKYIHKKNK